MDICSVEFTAVLSPERTHDFLFNKSKDILTGPRRMGREHLVDKV